MSRIQLKSYYINFRKRWFLIPSLWNKFWSNLNFDYNTLKTQIDDSEIQTIETDLRSKFNLFIVKKS